MSSSDSSSWHPYFVFWTYFSKPVPSSRLNKTCFICDFGSQEELAIVPDPSSLSSPSSSLHEACVTLDFRSQEVAMVPDSSSLSTSSALTSTQFFSPSTSPLSTAVPLPRGREFVSVNGSISVFPFKVLSCGLF